VSADKPVYAQNYLNTSISTNQCSIYLCVSTTGVLISP